jgi:homogentisate 1,2-dioxygenase
MKRYIPVSRVEGTASRQAHCDLPEGTYEREMSKEGFFGPAAFFHHRHPPTGWTEFTGPLQPRAFDLARLATGAASPWSAHEVLVNAHCRIRYWRLPGRMPRLARNADGDELLFVHAGVGELYCDFGRLLIEDWWDTTRSSTPRCSTCRGSTPSSWRSSPTTRHGRSR